MEAFCTIVEWQASDFKRPRSRAVPIVLSSFLNAFCFSPRRLTRIVGVCNPLSQDCIPETIVTTAPEQRQLRDEREYENYWAQ